MVRVKKERSSSKAKVKRSKNKSIQSRSKFVKNKFKYVKVKPSKKKSSVKVSKINKKVTNLNKNNILICSGVSKAYGQNKVLINLNLAIKPNELFGIIGMSGSGKTTLLNVLIGFLRPDSGDVLFKTVDGMLPICQNPEKVKPVFGFAPQNPSFYPKLTVLENLEYFGTMYNLSKVQIKKNTNELLKLVNLFDYKELLGKELSFGMQKRLGIACALVHKPKVLILDEPTADLDPILRRETWELLSQVKKTGTTMIIASHLLDELEGECDRIAVLHDGKFNQIGTIDHLKKLYSTNNEVTLLTASKNYVNIITKLKAKKKLKVVKVLKKDNSLILQTPFSEEVVTEIVKIVKSSKDHIVKLHVSRPSLEDVFISTHNQQSLKNKKRN